MFARLIKPWTAHIDRSLESVLIGVGERLRNGQEGRKEGRKEGGQAGRLVKKEADLGSWDTHSLAFQHA